MTKEVLAFERVCREHNLAATHQRRVIYQAATAADGHPSPEEIFAIVRRQVPSISLATVYNNLKTFISAGVLREVSPHHGPLRLEPNLQPHAHVVCRVCKSISDIDVSCLEPVRVRRELPGFKAEHITVDVVGLCIECARKH